MQNTNSPMNENKKSTAGDSSKSKSFKNNAGDLIEKAGNKIADAGLPKVGQKIHDLGDSLEDHHENPSHSHKI